MLEGGVLALIVEYLHGLLMTPSSAAAAVTVAAPAEELVHAVLEGFVGFRGAQTPLGGAASDGTRSYIVYVHE